MVRKRSAIIIYARFMQMAEGMPSRREEITMEPLTDPMRTPSAAAPNGLPRGRKLMRRIALGVGVVLALMAGLALAGAGYEAIAARADAQAYPAPGQLVDAGGYRLHIY